MGELTTRVRRARPEDAAFIVAGNLAMAKETEGIELNEATLHAGVERMLTAASLGRYYVAEREGAVIGQLAVTYEWSDWRCGLFWWIQSVFVHPDARRTGVYSALYSHILEAAKADPDVCGIRLYVHHDNEGARATYSSLGMKAGRYELFEVDFQHG